MIKSFIKKASGPRVLAIAHINVLWAITGGVVISHMWSGCETDHNLTAFWALLLLMGWVSGAATACFIGKDD